jgi:hypothetical protein
MQIDRQSHGDSIFLSLIQVFHLERFDYIWFTIISRCMYVLFRENADIILKRISMDSSTSIDLMGTLDIYESIDIPSSDLILHYQRKTRKLYLLDKKYDQIRLWNKINSGKQVFFNVLVCPSTRQL